MTTATSRRPRLREIVQPHRIVISLILAVAIGLIWLAFTESRDGPVVTPTRPAAITRVFPPEAGLGLRQEPIGFELASGYAGELRIDGRDIPLDQLVRPQAPAPDGNNTPANRGLAGLNQYSFTPGKGQDIEELAPGEHRATVLYWRDGIETRDQAFSYSWTFRVS